MPEHGEECVGQQGIAVLVPFRVPDMDQHSFRVDVHDLQVDQFASS